jgi:hypothetical protein
MNSLYICDLCSQQFVYEKRLIKHKKNHGEDSLSEKNYECEFCLKSYSSKSSLIRHTKKCNVLHGYINFEQKIIRTIEEKHQKEQIQFKEEIKQTLEEQHQKEQIQFKEEIKQTIEEIKQMGLGNKTLNLNFNVICVGDKDNYLDMLAQEMGDFDRALEYIKDCALSEVTGDCKLIDKIYLAGRDPSESFCFVDKNKKKVQYFNEKKEKVVTTREIFCKKLVNNLQNSLPFFKKGNWRNTICNYGTNIFTIY